MNCRKISYRYLKIITLILAWCMSGEAQQKKIDSLKLLIPGKPDSVRTKIFYELAYEYVDLNDSLGGLYGARSFECARQIGDSLGMVKAARIRATAFRRLEKMDSAIALALSMLPVAKRNGWGTEVKQLLRGLAISYAYTAKYDLSIKCNFDLLRTTEQDTDSSERTYAFSNIGLTYYMLRHFETALKYYYQALKGKVFLERQNQLTRVYLNTSLCYSHIGDFSKADQFLRMGFYNSQLPGQGILAVEGLQAYGVFHLFKQNLDSAEIYILRSYSLTKELGNKRFLLNNLSVLTNIYLQKNQMSLAMKYLSEAESIMKTVPLDRESIGLYYRLFSFYKKTTDKKKLVLYQEKYIKLHDDVLSKTLVNSLMKIESEYLERGNKGKIDEQEQLLVLQDQVIKRINAFNILVIVMTVLLALLLYVLYRSNIEKKLANQLLEQWVRERTVTLEQSYLLFKQSSSMKDARLTKTLRAVKQHMATLRGLCNVGLRNGNESPTGNHFQQLATATTDVFLTLDNIPDVKAEYDL